MIHASLVPIGRTAVSKTACWGFESLGVRQVQFLSSAVEQHLDMVEVTSSILVGTTNYIQEVTMKTIYFENIRNREQFYCNDLKNVQLIDGIEYLRVFKLGTQRDMLVKKDSLRKVAKKQ